MRANGGVDRAARIQSSPAGRVMMRKTLPPLRSNDLLLDGFRYIRNLAQAVVDQSTARADSLDLVVCAATQGPEPKNGVAAVGQSQRQGHHDGLVRLITGGLNDGKGEVHADDRDVSLAKDLEGCPIQSAEISMPLRFGAGAGPERTGDHNPHAAILPRCSRLT